MRPVRQDAMRRHNLALVLQQIHLHGALTRAELTSRLGLSRSTIGDLVAEIAALGLLEEVVPAGGPRVGRPSHVVGPRSDGPFAVAVDLDVDRIVTAAVGLGGGLLARSVVQLPPGPVSPESVAARIAEAIPALRGAVSGDARPVGVGVSVPGTVDRCSYVVGQAPNLAWRDVPLGRLMQEAVPDLPVCVGNDADLAVMAEHHQGCARGCDDAIYLLGRVGVGAGILMDGRPLRGAGGLAGEFGHTVLDPAGPLCHCGTHGCVETFIGDAAVLRQTDGRTPVGEVIGSASRGDAQAAAAIRALADPLGRALANLVNLLNPRLIVMGGSLEQVLTLARAEVEAALDRHGMAAARAMVELRPSALGDDAPLLGAAQLAFAPLLADPMGVVESLPATG